MALGKDHRIPLVCVLLGLSARGASEEEQFSLSPDDLAVHLDVLSQKDAEDAGIFAEFELYLASTERIDIGEDQIVLCMLLPPVGCILV